MARQPSQLAQAKASNACGQRILLRRLGIAADELDRVYLAGGFAMAIDIENALAIGFLAQVRPERVERVGNPALRGASVLLLFRSRRAALSEIIGHIEHVELETEPDFSDLFVDGCQFMPIEGTAVSPRGSAQARGRMNAARIRRSGSRACQDKTTDPSSSVLMVAPTSAALASMVAARCSRVL